MCCYHYPISRRLMHYSDAKNPGFPGFFCKSFTMSFSIFLWIVSVAFSLGNQEEKDNYKLVSTYTVDSESISYNWYSTNSAYSADELGAAVSGRYNSGSGCTRA